MSRLFRVLRWWAGRLALLVAGSLLGLLLTEGLLRWRSPGGAAWLLANSPVLYDTRIFVVDPRWGLMLAPDTEGAFLTPEFQTTVQINALGLRGPAPSEEEEVLRVLAVGDSFTLAVQVPEEETFTARLAVKLSAALGRPVEVLNGGVDSHGTRDSALQVERIGAILPIDAVLLTFFTGNDLYDNCIYRHRRLHVGPQHPPPPLSPLRRISHLYTWMIVLQEQRALAHNPRLASRYREELAPFADARALQHTLPCTQDAIHSLLQVLAPRCTPGVVGLAPPAFGVQADRLAATFALADLDPAQATLDAPAAAVADLLPPNLPSVDLAPPLREAAQSRAMYFTFDGHWTAAAHAVVADAYFGPLQSALLHPPPCPPPSP